MLHIPVVLRAHARSVRARARKAIAVPAIGSVGPRGAQTQRADGVFVVAEAAVIVNAGEDHAGEDIGEVLLALVGRLGVAHTIRQPLEDSCDTCVSVVRVLAWFCAVLVPGPASSTDDAGMRTSHATMDKAGMITHMQHAPADRPLSVKLAL